MNIELTERNQATPGNDMDLENSEMHKFTKNLQNYFSVI